MRTITNRVRALGAAVAVLAVLGAAACGDDDTAAEPATTTAPPAPDAPAPDPAEPEVEPLRVLLTNDDGVDGPGLAALADALLALGDVELTIVAPARDRTGTGDQVTDGPVTGIEATTAAGNTAWSVEGYPADSVRWALDDLLDEPPHVVVSGANDGQNIGPIAPLSGTVGAARHAARRGIPAIAVSQGLGAGLDDEIDYTPAIEAAVAWVAEHRERLLDHDPGAGPVDVVSVNAPTCLVGEIRGVVEVPRAAEAAGRELLTNDCDSDLDDPADDVDAFLAGFVSISAFDPELTG